MADIELGKDYFIKKDDFKNPLGKGAFGEVFKSYSKKHKKKVYAIKRLIFPEGNPALGYIRSEIDILNELKHLMDKKEVKNAIKLYNHFENYDKNTKVHSFDLVFKYCDGGDLKSLIESYAPFSEEEIAYILHPIVECLYGLHKNLIVHRDIKPANIIFVKKWNPKHLEKTKTKLTDFGVSIMGEKNFESKVGTLLEMAPELINNEKCDSSIDVFSFGLIIYQMLFKTTAFNDLTYNSWYKSANAYINFPKCRFLTVECFDLVQRCLRYSPKERITFEEMKQHPFFTNKGKGRIFFEMFDGTQDINYVPMSGPMVDYIDMCNSEFDNDKDDSIFVNNNHVVNSIIKRNKEE